MNTGMIVFIVYLMNQVEQFLNIIASSIGFLLVVAICCGLIWLANHSVESWRSETKEQKERREGLSDSGKRWMIRTSCLALFLGFLIAITPNKKTIEAMAIAYGASEIIQSDAAKTVGAEIAKIAGKTSQVINKKLDEQLKK